MQQHEKGRATLGNPQERIEFQDGPRSEKSVAIASREAKKEGINFSCIKYSEPRVEKSAEARGGLVKESAPVKDSTDSFIIALVQIVLGAYIQGYRTEKATQEEVEVIGMT